MNATSKKPGLVLSPGQFDQLFPFHLVLSQELSISQLGPSLPSICPDLMTGNLLPEHFRLVLPEVEITFSSLAALGSCTTQWEHHASGLRFQGQLLPVHDGQSIAILWSPWLAENAEADRFGRFPESFDALHDPLYGLLELLQSHRTALQDERDLAEKLSEQRADLIQANAELSRQFSLLWEEMVNLKRIEAETFKIALIANNTENAGVMTDAAGRVEWVNDSFTQMTGYTLQEMRGKTPGSVLQGEKTDSVVVDYTRRQMQAGESFGADILNYAKSGREYWVQFEVQPIRDEDNKITNWMAIERDITEQKQAELALLEAKRAAEAASRAKSAFLATMSHEIRTPMNAVLGTLALLLDSPLDEEQQLWATSSYAAAQSLLSIIDDVLDFSKIEAGKLSLSRVNFDLKSLITEVIQIFQVRTEGSGLSLGFSISPETPQIVCGDASRLKQILINLVGNAVKFTEHGGITVDVRCLDRSESKMKLSLHVQDSGIGIPEDAIASLFDQFVQVDSGASRRYGGTGLGLAICKRLAQLMGGEIGVNSQFGRGSEFWFTVELDNPTEPAPGLLDARETASTQIDAEQKPRIKKQATGHGNPRHPSQKAARILVAEDGEVNRLVVTAMLGKAGYQVDVAEDGGKAVESARTGDYDLILMDVQMPEMDGYQATAMIRGLNGPKARVPILAFTANAMQEDRNACLAAGMNDFIAKPVEKERLLTTISSWLRKDSHAATTVIEPNEKHLGLLDKECIDALSDHMDEHLLKETVAIFVADTAARCARMVSALGTGDHNALGFEAHSIKSAAMTMGASSLALACRSIEEALSQGDARGATRLAGELDGVFKETRAAFAGLGLLAGQDMR